ncbi:response regulator [Haloglomus salinum]|jgi:chemotaxis family two-component system response regulator Rcp1|uniref:response regulator n=1 Tax=Haloglomus salinum TaxID=2962673 RepID=UPI0020C97A57|nr:response regulator [Haloglomus salinum]
MAADRSADRMPERDVAPVEVLMVEDNPGDARLAEEAFDALDRLVELTVVADGTAALDRLLSTDSVPPALVLLDLDLPDITGRNVLERLKSEPAVRHIPVVVFSSSDDPADIRETYDHHANAYMTKPRDADEFFRTIRRLDAFWFSAAALPRGGDA